MNPATKFGSNPTKARDEFLALAFNNSIEFLEQSLGSSMEGWRYGQDKYKHTYMIHPLGTAVNQSWADSLNLGPLPRGGNGFTPGSTGNNNRQSSGASFRMIVSTGDWDKAIGTNGPGQSGDPASPFYSNLFEPWAKDQYFPVFYSRSKIDSVAVERIRYLPD